MQRKKIPFTICFGNHDRQVGLSNEEQFEIYKEFDYFIGESVEGIDGCANHVIEIKDGDEIKFLLYLIDSHSSLEIGYDNVHENQIEWYKTHVTVMRKIQSSYSVNCYSAHPALRGV